MKICRKCHKTYTDETLSFCLADGTPLIREAGTPYDSQATMVSHGPMTADTVPQRHGITTPGYADQSAPGWAQPNVPQYGAPPEQKRSLLPWVLGGVAVLLLGVVGLGVIAALVYASGSNRNKTAIDVKMPANSNSKSNSKSKDTGKDYSDRVGRYTGTATNTTVDATGDAVIDITEIDNSTGAVKVEMDYSNGLCGQSSSSGTINKSTDVMTLTGPLTPSGGDDCPTDTWTMATRCTFAGTDTLKCTYRLTRPENDPQAGRFEVTKQ